MGRTKCSTIIAIIAIALPHVVHAQERPSLDFLDVPERPGGDRARVSARSVRALEEVERELDRFDASARAYRGDVESQTRRRLRERQRAAMARYAQSLRTERSLEAGARTRAMDELRTFLARHPNGREHRANALLRLAELSLLSHLDAFDPERAEYPELREAIGLARTFIREFPNERRFDHAAYLLGYALVETGREHEALDVWRSIVCPNAADDAPAEAIEPMHPAFDRGSPRSIGSDPYARCAHGRATALAPEVWLRIGEHHFERGDGDLAAAISAYEHSASSPAHPLYAFALYKLAWSHYRASHFAQAIEQFGRLVDHSDHALRETGRAGSDLRAEAIQYIALALAYEDWNEDGVRDREQGGLSTSDRVADPSLVPRDLPWAREILRRTGEVLYEEAREDEAIAVWRETLRRFPHACDAPELWMSIVRAHRRLDQTDEMFDALAEISRQHGGEWSPRSCSPEALLRAERTAEQAIATAGVLHHQRAQAMRAALRTGEANEEYALAARAYELYLERFPNSPRAYELAYDRADALFWSGRHEEAARAYASVRDSRFDDRLFAHAAHRHVVALARVLDGSGIALRAEPALESGVPRAETVPEPLQRLARAREIYVRWIDERDDAAGVRDAYAYNNALMLYRYGFWPEARARFASIFRERCAARGSDVGRSAWDVMRRMAAATGDLDELERLSGALRESACNSDPGEIDALEANVALRRLERDAASVPAQADSEARRARAESIASRLVAAIDRAPNHPDAPAVLQRAARLLQNEAARPARAESVYRRIVEEYAGDDAIAADAHFQLARIAQRVYDVDRALAGYAALGASERFARSGDASVRTLRRDAQVNAALLASDAGRHHDAARLWTAAARSLEGAELREASLRAAEETLASGDARGAGRLLDAWIRSHARSSDALTVRAHWARAESARRSGDRNAHARSLEAALATFRRSDDRAPSVSIAADAAIALADLRAAAEHPQPIRVDAQATARASIERLRARVNEEIARARGVLDAYDDAVEIGVAPVSVRALAQQGEALEELVRTVLGAEVALPRDLARAISSASPEGRRAARAAFDDAIESALDDLVRPVECRALTRYLLALRLARRGGIASAEADRALDRLAAYGDERARECIDEARGQDASLAPLAPREIERVRRGRHEPARDLAPPPLAP